MGEVSDCESRIVPMRLQKFLARAGAASRRGSENLMTAGRVTVNGKVVTELGSKVDPLVDEVAVDGAVVRLADGLSLIHISLPGTPTMLRYDTHVDAKSLYNTPPAYGIYMCGKVFQWLKAQGGLEAMKERNVEKAQLLYDFLDQSALFKGTARKEDRSCLLYTSRCV